jgi:hypothetical protein
LAITVIRKISADGIECIVPAGSVTYNADRSSRIHSHLQKKLIDNTADFLYIDAPVHCIQNERKNHRNEKNISAARLFRTAACGVFLPEKTE